MPNKKHNQDTNERKCRICGCTDDNCSQCIAATGFACHWVEKDLCSRCYELISQEVNMSFKDLFKFLMENDLDLSIDIGKDQTMFNFKSVKQQKSYHRIIPNSRILSVESDAVKEMVDRLFDDKITKTPGQLFHPVYALGEPD